jgi:hypothetical protein
VPLGEGSGKQEEYFTFYASYFHGENTVAQLKRGKRGGASATSGIHFENVLQCLGIADAVFEKTLFAPSGYDASQAVVAAMHTGLRILVSARFDYQTNRISRYRTFCVYSV